MPPMISGDLPFGNSGAGMVSAIPGAGALGQQYEQAYNSALSQNQANYQNILKGYQDTQANQFTQNQAIGAGYEGLAGRIGQGYEALGGSLGRAYQGLAAGVTGNLQSASDANLANMVGGQRNIQAGYSNLGGQIQGTLANAEASQRQAILDQYAQFTGKTTQGLLNSGLGNTTVMGAMQRGNALDRAKAEVALANQFAQTRAGYQNQIGQNYLNWQDQANQQQVNQRNWLAGQQAQRSSDIYQSGLRSTQDLGQQRLATESGIGQAGLAFQGQANQQQVGQANRQLDFMNSVQAKYPDAGQYSQVLMQQGMMEQMRNQQALAAQQYAEQQKAQQQLLARGQAAGIGGGFQQRNMGTYDTSGMPMGMPSSIPGGAQSFPVGGGQPMPLRPPVGGAGGNIQDYLPWNQEGGDQTGSLWGAAKSLYGGDWGQAPADATGSLWGAARSLYGQQAGVSGAAAGAGIGDVNSDWDWNQSRDW